MDDTKKQRILELHSQGIGERKIAAQVGAGKTTVHRVIADSVNDKPESVEEVQEKIDDAPRILTADKRFANLLELYCDKIDVPRVISYADSFGAGVYQDVIQLRRILSDQGIVSTRIPAILRHWGNLEGLSVSLENIVSNTSAQPVTPKKYSIVNGQPTIDMENGEMTWIQCLQLLELQTKQQMQPGPNLEVEALRKELADEREKRHTAELARRDVEVQKLSEQVSKLAAAPPPGQKSELDILDSGLNLVKSELGEIRKAVFEMLKPLPPPLSSSEKYEAKNAIAALGGGQSPSKDQQLLPRSGTL